MGKRVKRNELGLNKKKEEEEDYQANGVSNWGLGNRGGFASSGDERSKFDCTAVPCMSLCESQKDHPAINNVSLIIT